MKIIMCLMDKIDEELHDADSYIDLAIKWKGEDEDASELFYELSTEEMGHMEKLHKEVSELIEEYRKEHGDPPKEMMTLYDYLHGKHVATATQIRIKQGMYKGV